MMGIMNLFKVMIVVQLFFSVVITLIAYGVPADARIYISSYSDLAGNINLQQTSSDIQSSLQQQTNIPVIDIGALVFYSGNILLDLMLNFAFAIPQMLGLLIHGMLFLIGIDTYIWATIEMFCSVLVMILYGIALMELLTSIRSGQRISG